MTETTLQEVGQFAGNVPLTGYNIQKHSVNAAILRKMPIDTVRSAITHFGTRGLFGKATQRTAQHDKDNKRRKDWRGSQALKPNPGPYPMPVPRRKYRLSGDRGVSKANARGQPVPGPPGREIVLDFRPRPLPSSSSIETSSSSPAHSTRDIPLTANEGRLVHDKAMHPGPRPLSSPPHIAILSSPPTRSTCDLHEHTPATAAEDHLFHHKTMYSRPQAVTGLRLEDGTLPTSANCNSPVLFPPSRFSGSGMVHPSYISPTNVVIHRNPTVATSLPYDVHANQTRASFDSVYAPPMSTSTGQMVDAPPFTTEPTRSRGASDVSTSVQTFVAQTYPASLGAPHSFSAPASNESFTDRTVDLRIDKSLPTQGRPLRQGTAYQASDAPRGGPESGHPFAAFAGDQIPLHFNYFAEPGTTHAWNPSQATRDRYANENETAFAPYAAMPAMTYRNAHPIRGYTPLNNGNATSMRSSAGYEGKGSVSSPPTAYYSSYPASWSHAAAFDPHRLSDETVMHASPMQSDGLVNAFFDYYPGPRSALYGDSALAVRSSADPVANRGLIHSLTSAPQAGWHVVPQRGIAPIAGHSVNAFTGGWTQVDASASCLCAECIPREANYAQGFEGCFDAHYSSMLPATPRPDYVYLDSTRGQWDGGVYLNAPSSCFPPTSLHYPYRL